ncbi:hypothetical protein ACQI4F_20550 [Mycolicibacterium vaccae]|uniref:WXG100-like domain-containing protein n=1 Tax=Mycolicibacterium vaccae TaxID=1810 RepID=UPI003CF58D3F
MGLTTEITVEPDALIAAGRHTGSLGTQLNRLSNALGGALGGGIASGMDPAGADFGLKYGRQAQEFANAVADAANAFNAVGSLLEATGFNYRNADTASTIGGPGPGGGVSGEAEKTLPAHVPPGPNGSTVPPPTKWYLIQPLLQVFGGLGGRLAMTWPSGNPAMMRLTAEQWRNFASGFAAIERQLAAVRSAVGAQSIPEGDAILAATDNLGQALTTLSEVSSTVSQSVSDFADAVSETQDAIRRLLERLSVGGLWDTVTGFLTGEGDDILREVADDVGTVLEHFQRQIKGVVGLLEELTIAIGEAATAFQKWIRPVLVEHFGETVGGMIAENIKHQLDFRVGLVTGLINTVAGTVALADPDTWTDMAELAQSVAQDPASLPGVLANMGREFVAWDKWSGENPGRAAGEAAFNIGSLFVPGGAFSKTGTVAKGLSVTRRALGEGRLPNVIPAKVPGVPQISPRTAPAPPRLEPPPGPAPASPSAEGGPGQRAPAEQPGRGQDRPTATPRPEVFTTQSDQDIRSKIADDLNDAYIRRSAPIDDLVRRLSDLATHHIAAPEHSAHQANRVVLGKWDGEDGGYIGEARANGGIYYDTGPESWDNLTVGLSREQVTDLGWQVNERFLRTQLENGVARIEYILDGRYQSLADVLIERPGSFSAMEIEYLTEHAPQYGYTRIGSSWIKE